jgi:6-pyruvoyltetrahydropterin/6-carboxytetrahydropterin synthase
MASMFLRRRATFAAAHAYYLPDRTEEENRQLFGRWASKWGHGHNYVVEATVAGEIDAVTGMVVNITDVDRVLKERVVGPLGDRHLTYDVAHFASTPPTLENIARFIAGEIRSHFDSPVARLARLTLWEMPTLWVSLDTGKNEPMIGLTRAIDFAASHRLHALGLSDGDNRSLFGKCDNPNGHGHNYGVEVTVVGTPDPVTGMIVDLAALDAVLDREVMARFDHKHLNLDVPDFKDLNPTSENVTKVIWDHLENAIPAPARLYRVVVRETERNYFEYYGAAGPERLTL